MEGAGRTYNFSPIVKNVRDSFFFGEEEGKFGLLSDEGYKEYASVEELLRNLKPSKVNLVSYGGMLKDFHAFKKVAKVRALGRWTASFSFQGKQVYLFDLLGFGSHAGCASLAEWAKRWNVNYGEGLKERLLALKELYKKIQSLGGELTPGRTARKVVAEWLGKPLVSFMPQSPKLVGARTQIFKHYGTEVYIYDFNSTYPTVMARTFLPRLEDKGSLWVQILRPAQEKEVKAYVENFGLLWSKLLSDAPTVDNVRRLSEFFKTYYFLKVRITGARAGARPPFPFAGLFKEKRAFGYFKNGEYYVAGYEVPLLYEYEFEVLEALASPAERLPFAEKVEELYQKRQEAKGLGDEVRDRYYKALLNSVFGVFGIKQRHGREKSFFFKDAKELKKHLAGASLQEREDYGNVVRWRYKKGNKVLFLYTLSEGYLLIERPDEEEFIGTSAPGIAAAIPANGRFLLYWLLRYLFERGFEVYYCDTDSVHVSCPPEFIKDLIGTDLGQLKLEGFFSRAYYFAPKTYYLEDSQGVGTLVAKGVQDFEDEVVIHSFNVSEPKVLFRRAVDPDSVPTYVPNAEGYAVLNVEDKKFKETPLYETYLACKEKSQKEKASRELTF